MNIKQYLVRNFSYDHWANRECLSAIAAANPMPPKALRFMAHTISAQKLWLERLQGEPQTIAVWPTFTIEECSTLVNEMQSAWKNYLNELLAGDLENDIGYRNSKGEPWSS